MVEADELSGIDRMYEKASLLAGFVDETREVFRDPVNALILAVLLSSPGPVGGEKLYRMVSEELKSWVAKGRVSGVSGVSRGAFFRRLNQLIKYGLVAPVGKGRRRGPYIVRPSVRWLFTRVAVDKELGLFERMEEELYREACKFIKALREGRLFEAFLSLNRLELYFESEAKGLLYMMLEELFFIKNIQSKNMDDLPPIKAKLVEAVGKLEPLPEEDRDEIIQYTIARALYLTISLYHIQIPLIALYKAIMKEKCYFN